MGKRGEYIMPFYPSWSGRVGDTSCWLSIFDRVNRLKPPIMLEEKWQGLGSVYPPLRKPSRYKRRNRNPKWESPVFKIEAFVTLQ
jgi:hypothetical protein